jgi:hypothetical protein
MLKRVFVVATLVAVLVAIVVVSGAAANANPTANYGVAPTKSCLANKGAAIGSDFAGADSELSGAERARLISATVTGPSFLYIAFGKNPSEAKVLRAKVSKTLAPPPNSTNSLAGESGNVAWVLVSALGTRPAASMRAFVTGCLRIGTVPTGADALTPITFSHCLGSRAGNSILDARELKLLFGVDLPPSLRSHIAIAYVIGMRGARYGSYAFVFFGDTRSQALRYRDTFTVALGRSVARQSTGVNGKVAWLITPSKRASDAAAVAAKRVFLSCLS